MSVELAVERRVVPGETYQFRNWLNGHQFLLEGVDHRRGKDRRVRRDEPTDVGFVR
ncbi:hypothetical protein [Streptomyces puniciscabiei]|uniref:hypothetical protein n=1 Tax=Streptomyces puniciscabiei TaxID=164348 RepID=UPI0033164FCE